MGLDSLPVSFIILQDFRLVHVQTVPLKLAASTNHCMYDLSFPINASSCLCPSQTNPLSRRHHLSPSTHELSIKSHGLILLSKGFEVSKRFS